MVKVKSQSEIKKNYEASTSLVTERYKTGVSSATWKEEAKGGQDLYESMMSDPDVLARREKGIDRVSDEEWRRAAADKGAPIIASRMKGASAKQAARFEPYRNVLESLSLEPRTADTDLNIDNRVKPIARAFRNKKNEIG